MGHIQPVGLLLVVGHEITAVTIAMVASPVLLPVLPHGRRQGRGVAGSESCKCRSVRSMPCNEDVEDKEESEARLSNKRNKITNRFDV